MARLLSVNVGLPRDIEWRGRTVHTGIWKNPVHGRCRVGRLNLDGDGQGDLAGHGGEQRAVFVYQIESYRYWQEQLKRTELRPRTVRRELHDRRVARRCGLHRRPLSDRERALRSHATSRYLLSRWHSDERAPNAGAADLQRTPWVLLPRSAGRRGGRGRRNREGGRGQGANDGRGDQCASLFSRIIRAICWSAHCESRRFRPGGAGRSRHCCGAPTSGNAGLVPEAAAHPAAPGFHRLAVTSIDRESADVLSVTMQSPDGQPLPAALPGQYVVLRLQPAAGGRRFFEATRSRALFRPSAIESA